MDIKPLETWYKGVRFRSRLEARWAIYFDYMGIKWEYEKEGYALPSGNYLPDYWLPQVNMWVEVKPTLFDLEERTRCEELAEATKSQVLMLVGRPMAVSYTAITPDPAGLFTEDYVLDNEYINTEQRFWSDTIENESDCFQSDVHDAVQAALTATFDNGVFNG